MGLRRRRTQLPDDVRELLDVQRDGTVLAAAELTDGWAVATVAGVRYVRGDRPAVARDWSDVDGARLDGETEQLTLTWVDGTAPTVLHLADASTAFPRAVHERVQASVVHSERVRVPSGAAVRVALRRDAHGGLLTQVIGPGDVDLDDPGTAAVVDATEARVREAAGLR